MKNPAVEICYRPAGAPSPEAVEAARSAVAEAKATGSAADIREAIRAFDLASQPALILVARINGTEFPVDDFAVMPGTAAGEMALSMTLTPDTVNIGESLGHQGADVEVSA